MQISQHLMLSYHCEGRGVPSLKRHQDMKIKGQKCQNFFSLFQIIHFLAALWFFFYVYLFVTCGLIIDSTTLLLYSWMCGFNDKLIARICSRKGWQFIGLSDTVPPTKSLSNTARNYYSEYLNIGQKKAQYFLLLIRKENWSEQSEVLLHEIFVR